MLYQLLPRYFFLFIPLLLVRSAFGLKGLEESSLVSRPWGGNLGIYKADVYSIIARSHLANTVGPVSIA